MWSPRLSRWKETVASCQTAFAPVRSGTDGHFGNNPYWIGSMIITIAQNPLAFTAQIARNIEGLVTTSKSTKRSSFKLHYIDVSNPTAIRVTSLLITPRVSLSTTHLKMFPISAPPPMLQVARPS